MIVRIDVTQEDIDKGCRYAASNCPVARALARVGIPNPAVCSTVEAWESAAHTEGKPLWIRNLPAIVYRFIDDFDAGCTVHPFSFNLRLPRSFIQPADPIGPELARNKELRKELEESDSRLDALLSPAEADAPVALSRRLWWT